MDNNICSSASEKQLMDVRCSKLTVSHNLPFSQAGPDKLCETAAVLVSGRQWIVSCDRKSTEMNALGETRFTFSPSWILTLKVFSDHF